jgi:hypothetical protein
MATQVRATVFDLRTFMRAAAVTKLPDVDPQRVAVVGIQHG